MGSTTSRLLVMIDDNLKYDERVVNILKTESKKGLFEFKTFEHVKPAFEEMEKYQSNLKMILVIVQGTQYPDYYELYHELKINKKLKFVLISFIYTGKYINVLEGREKDKNREIKKEVLDSVRDKFYNPGGIETHPNDIYQFIKNYWNIDLPSDKQEVSAFNIESCDDDIFLLVVLYNLFSKRNILLKEEDIRNLNYKLRIQHPFEKQYNDFLDLKYFDIDITTEFWINYYTSKSTFYQGMARDFNIDHFSNYEPFIKALYRGLHKKNLKSKYDAKLYSCCPITKDNLEKLENNLKEKKQTLIYTKQFQSFTQSEELAKNYIDNIKVKDSVPVLYEINKLESRKAFASNIDIGDLSFFPDNKGVLFFPYTCFILESIEKKKMKINSKNMEVKVIKLNYLGNYTHKINDLLKNLDEKKIESLLKNKNSKLTNYIIRKNKEEFPNMDQNDFIKALLLQANLIKEKNRPKNIIEIKMDKKGKFISDTFYTKYNWMLDVYFDGKLQDLDINETNDEIPEQITIEINYPLYDIESMFYDCDCIKEINFVKFNMTHITSLKSLFSECRSLTKVNVEIFETKNVTDMSSLFYNCYSLTKLNLSNFKLDNVKDMSAMFYMCMNLKELNFKLNEQNAKKLEDISCIFLGCHSIQKYDLLALDITKIKFKDHYI